jgi:hypothetical protein
VAALLGALMPGLSGVQVLRAAAVEQRDIHTAIWKAHRARFVGQGEMARALGASAVLGALKSVGPGQLQAVLVSTGGEPVLAWLNMEQQTCIAAFDDAHGLLGL